MRPILSALLGIAVLAGASQRAIAADRPPNVIVVFADDLGYGDLGCYGQTRWQTPHLDRLAREGVRFTDFYVAQAVCSSSRVSLLTGCYPNRLGIVGALGPKATIGIADDETTLGQICRSRGYATACIGKWHLGHHQRFLPPRHGFDSYYGLPYSNDMGPLHDEGPDGWPDLPLIEGERTIELNPDLSGLTAEYTRRAVEFIRSHRERPFFLYLAHTMVHVPLAAAPPFVGRSSAGLFGDAIAEIDDGVGQILSTLAELGLDENTLVLFSSDNGPWLVFGNHAGSAGPLREGKGTTFEGGVRVPLVARWPGHIPAGTVCRQPAMTIDLLPTIAGLVGAKLPARPIDGRDIWPLLAGQPGAKSPHEVLYFYWLDALEAVRRGRWKLHVPHAYPHLVRPGSNAKRGEYELAVTDLALFDLAEDEGETTDVAAEHPDVVRQLLADMEAARADLGDRATGQAGAGVRQPGRLAQAERN